MNISLSDIVGLAGTSCVLICYMLVQTKRLSATSSIYQILNMFGCGLIFYSLIFNFNLASMLIQIAWFLISFYGLLCNFRLKRRGVK